MYHFNPLPRVRARRFLNMDGEDRQNQIIDMQAMYNNMVQLERRVNELQFQNNQLQAQQNAAPAAREVAQPDIFRIPDPIKTIPTFDGNKKQLNAWLTTAERTLRLFANRVPVDVYSLYEQTVINKIEGKARDTICVNGDPASFTDVVEILRTMYGDRNDMATYQTQLWSLKMDESLHSYYKRTKEIIQNMKSLAKQKELYRSHWEAINDFLDKECLAAFINGLSKPYFGYAQASGPEDLEMAYAFLCKFQNAEQTKKHTQQPSKSNFESQSNRNNSKQFKPSNKQMQNETRPKANSDRRNITPMEIDPSLRSAQNRIFNHNVEPEEENPEESQEESDSEPEEEINFQIGIQKTSVK